MAATQLQAINLTKGNAIVARRVEWAETSAQRRRGLLGRSGLDVEEAMYIAPCQWIHTFKMQFPIDVAFLAENGKVLSLQRGLKANRLSKIVLRAEGVLELAAGRLLATHTEVGDVIAFQEISAPR
jgi:uncharacterized protein